MNTIQTSYKEALERLEQSVNSLEKSIVEARTKLKKENSREYIERTGTYLEIVEKQRKYAAELKKVINEKNYQETGRLVSLINGLSHMVHEDAVCILKSLANNKDKEF